MRRAVALLAAILAFVPGAAGGSAASVRVLVFGEPGFPAVDAPAPDLALLQRSLAGCDVSVAGLDSLPAAIERVHPTVLVLPYGSAFPAAAWPAIRKFLAAGGSWVNLGGAPLAVPVERERGGWRALSRRASYQRQVGIVRAEAVAADGLEFRAGSADEAGPALMGVDAPRSVQELTIRLTARKSHPDEDGSDGPREAILTPLVHGFARREALPRVAPVVRIDRREGEFAGGRWLFATGDAPLPEKAIAALVHDASGGACELRVQPELAIFRPGEPIAIRVTLSMPGRIAADAVTGPCRLGLCDRSGRRLGVAEATLAPERAGGRGARIVVDRLTARLTAPRGWPERLGAGLYAIRAELPLGGGPAGPTLVAAESGFRIGEAASIVGGAAFTATADGFRRDGQPLPVTGSTYMASDVHRRFLLEPNPWLWERDFAAMAAAGVNLVRTGIWTGWDEHCAPGDPATAPVPSEATLRALEAFLLTAREHGMPVIFTFFAFVPPAWGGENPYLDPRAVAAQREFVAAFARRFVGARDLAWDLINEPSFSSPAHLWQCRPNYDASEKRAWAEWLRGLAGGGDPAAFVRNRWGTVDDDSLRLPPLAEFEDRNLFGKSHPVRAADYRRFAQDAFARWIRDITKAIRDAGAGQLVTVGQDEGGLGERPGPLFFAADVDFTCNHTWWNDGDLLWDALLARAPGKPLLIEETGLMTYERPDGSSLRTPEEARDLLERKLVLAFAAGGAGFVQWCWNTNPYMPSDNEAGIGFLRVDGTAKPELAAFSSIAAFARRQADRLTGREPEAAVVVVPQSEQLSDRDLATAATRRAVRVLEYYLGFPARAVGENAVAAGALATSPEPALIVLPAPRVLRQDAWEALLAAVRAGAQLCVSGTIDRDEAERPVGRSVELGLPATARPVAPQEEINEGENGEIWIATFRGLFPNRAETAVLADALSAVAPTDVRVIRLGKGRVFWSPAPVELAEEPLAARCLYHAPRITWLAAHQHVVDPDPRVLARPVVYRDAILFCVTNETTRARTVRLVADGSGAPVTAEVAAGRSALLLVDRRSGAVVDRCGAE